MWNSLRGWRTRILSVILFGICLSILLSESAANRRVGTYTEDGTKFSVSRITTYILLFPAMMTTISLLVNYIKTGADCYKNENKKFLMEFKYCIINSCITLPIPLALRDEFIARGYSNLFDSFSEHSFAYHIASIIIYLALTDFASFLVHILLHRNSYLYNQVHALHHQFKQPSAFAGAVGSHPVEILLNTFAAIPWTFLPLSFLRMNVYVNIFASLLVMIWVIWDHTGDLSLSLTDEAVLSPPLFISSEHHLLHHQYVHCQYGLMFGIWDDLFQSNKKMYEQAKQRQQQSNGNGNGHANGNGHKTE